MKRPTKKEWNEMAESRLLILMNSYDKIISTDASLEMNRRYPGYSWYKIKKEVIELKQKMMRGR